MIVWQPNLGAQADAISARWCNELFYGGARGGGKSDFMLADFLQDVPTYHKFWHGIVFRKSYPELEELLKRARQLFPQTGATYKSQNRTWVWKNGATLKFRYAERLADLDNYQGHQYAWIGVDEATNFSFIEEMLGKLRACQRGGEIPIPEKRIRLSGNPGGAGHASIKKLFIDPAPQGYKVTEIVVDDLVITQMFIPAKLADNPVLTKNDPTYIARLKMVGSPELVRMWLDGDWDVVVGAFFNLTKQNLCTRFEIPSHWPKYIGQDWGYGAPFAATWIAISSGFDDEGKPLPQTPKGRIIVYRAIKKAKVENTVQAEMVHDASIGETITRAALDPACGFKSDNDKSIAKQLNNRLHELNSQWYYQEAINNRVHGWSYLREQINLGNLVIFDDLISLITDLQTLPTNPDNVEDCLTEAEDHLPDSLRYATMQYLVDSVYSEIQEIRPISQGVDLGRLIKIYKNKHKNQVTL